jgi:type IV pilus assembly protein PilZ
MVEGSQPPGAERREEERAAITLKVDYKRLNTFFADYTKNISRGGTFIRTIKPFDIGTEFVFVLTVPEPNLDNAPMRLELTGRVKWVVPSSAASESEPAGMGIQFVFKDDTERERVETFVADLMKASLGEHLAEKLLARAHKP